MISALIGREHLRQHVLVEVDVADGLALQKEGFLSDFADLDGGHLLFVQIDGQLSGSP